LTVVDRQTSFAHRSPTRGSVTTPTICGFKGQFVPSVVVLPAVGVALGLLPSPLATYRRCVPLTRLNAPVHLFQEAKTRSRHNARTHLGRIVNARVSGLVEVQRQNRQGARPPIVGNVDAETVPTWPSSSLEIASYQRWASNWASRCAVSASRRQRGGAKQLHDCLCQVSEGCRSTYGTDTVVL
jgi:hypothetical protein